LAHFLAKFKIIFPFHFDNWSLVQPWEAKLPFGWPGFNQGFKWLFQGQEGLTEDFITQKSILFISPGVEGKKTFSY